MHAGSPAVFLAHAHASNKTKGTQALRSRHRELSEGREGFLWLREGHGAAPVAAEVFAGQGSAQPISGIHLLGGGELTTSWWMNDYAGKQRQIEGDALQLDRVKGLVWVWIEGVQSAEFCEKMLFGGANVVLCGNGKLAEGWYDGLLEGLSLRQAWERLEAGPVTPIPSDPFAYWNWREQRSDEATGSAMFVFSHKIDFLDEKICLGTPKVSRPAEPASKKKQEEEQVSSWVLQEGSRSLDQARREELEYRHPQEARVSAQALVLANGFEAEWGIPEERVAEITSREDFRFQPRRRILATVMSACLGVGLLMVGFWQMGWQLSHEQRDRLAYFSTFSDSAGFRVILLPFNREEGCSPTEVWDEMAVRDFLMLSPESKELNLEVTYLTPGSCPDREEDARRLAEIYHADLLVWGDASHTGSQQLQLHYVLAEGASDLQLKRLMERHRLANGYLGGSPEGVVAQILALGFFAHQRPREAMIQLNPTEEVPWSVAVWRELAIVLSLEELHQPEMALERCQLALGTLGDQPALSFHARRLKDIVFPPSSATQSDEEKPAGPAFASSER